MQVLENIINKQLLNGNMKQIEQNRCSLDTLKLANYCVMIAQIMSSNVSSQYAKSTYVLSSSGCSWLAIEFFLSRKNIPNCLPLLDFFPTSAPKQIYLQQIGATRWAHTKMFGNESNQNIHDYKLIPLMNHKHKHFASESLLQLKRIFHIYSIAFGRTKETHRNLTKSITFT